ncbi:hypothetical protein PLESTB_001979900 [Pleodorina starrii]|uniref:GIY-YIG domain-containing protein n=1 Tax=Pleodorina starrii TaxID=330485 RepID=A0A9W6C3Y4_9CHLO|nr:hypothetical protein PLESTB_001979900 [Pleodorina starrii]
MGHPEPDGPHYETEAHARHRDEPAPNGRFAVQGSLDLHLITENAGAAAEESGDCRPSDGLERVILQEKSVPRGSSMIIYRATNRITGKIYIGKTVRHLYHAKARHRQRAMRRDLYGSDSYFYAAIRKHGWSAFDWTIIDQGENDTELQALERAWIAQTGSYRDRSIGYNMTPGGDGGAGRKLSPEQIAGISLRSSGKGNPGWGKFGKAHPAYGHIKSPEVRAAISRAHKGKKVSSETRAKLSATRVAMFAEQRRETLRRQEEERCARRAAQAAKKAAGGFKGEKARASKVTDQQRAEICRRRAAGESYSAIARDVSLKLTGVRAVVLHWGPLNGYPFLRVVAASNHRAKLTDKDRMTIISRYNDGEAIAALASAFNVITAALTVAAAGTACRQPAMLKASADMNLADLKAIQSRAQDLVQAKVDQKLDNAA